MKPACYALPMRYLLALVVVSAALFAALTAFGRSVPRAEAPELLALAYPTTLYVGERAALYGGFSVPAGKYELGAYACEADACRRLTWRTIDGPQDRTSLMVSASSLVPDASPGFAVVRVSRYEPIVFRRSRALACSGVASVVMGKVTLGLAG